MSVNDRLVFLEQSIESIVGVMETSSKNIEILMASLEKTMLSVVAMSKRIDKLEKAVKGLRF